LDPIIQRPCSFLRRKECLSNFPKSHEPRFQTIGSMPLLSDPSLDRDVLPWLGLIAIINVEATVIDGLLPPAVFVDTVNRKLVAPSPVSSPSSGALMVF